MAFSPVFQRPFSATFDRRAAAAGNGLLNALIAYWPGNEASGNLQDAHTNALHLTDTNTVTNAVGKVYATARQYTAANMEYHARASEALLQTGDVDFTFAAWVYLTQKDTNRIVVGKDADGGRDYNLFFRNNVDRFQMELFRSGPAPVTVTANNYGSPPMNAWVFVVAWHDSGADTLNIQVNNGTVDSAASGGALQAATTTEFCIGKRAYSAIEGYWNGRIGPVAMWKSAAGGGGCLSAAQRTALWNGGAGLAYAQFTT